MELWHWQILTAIPMGCMCIYLYIIVGNLMRKSESTGEIVWIVEAERSGSVKKLELPEGNFLVGTGLFNDIHLRIKGKGVRLYMNVQKSSIILSVLKGKIRIGNITYKNNERERIPISDEKSVIIDNLKLTFYRKRVK